MKRCSKCASYRKVLYIFLSCWEKRASDGRMAHDSHTNFRYLNTPKKVPTTSGETQAQLDRLRAQLDKAIQEEGVEVNKELYADLQQLIFEAPLYETLRESGCIALPTQRTLRDYTHFVSSTSGFSKEVDAQLLSATKLDSLKEFQKCVSLIMDEMYIKEDLVYITYIHVKLPCRYLCTFVAISEITGGGEGSPNSSKDNVCFDGERPLHSFTISISPVPVFCTLW